MGETDILLVGGGLAGTLLALECENLGLRVVLVDTPRPDSASRVAAGLLNPVTGVRLSPTEDADALVPHAVSVFQALERKLKGRFFRSLPVFRAYENAGEIAQKAKRAANPRHARWFGPDIPPELVHPALNAPLGGFMILDGGRVDLPALLDAAHAYFGKGEGGTGNAEQETVTSGFISLRTERFEHAELGILPEGRGVRYRDITARRIVFAEGAAVAHNPWFGHLPWQPAKGEFITCVTPWEFGPEAALKIGLSAIPAGDGRWFVGSNYEWNTLDTTPTPAVRDTLLAGFEKMFRAPTGAVVTEHRAGIRPAARGAKPIVGPHPEHPALHVFNGFGAKGCTRAPSFARDHAARLAGELASGR